MCNTRSFALSLSRLFLVPSKLVATHAHAKTSIASDGSYVPEKAYWTTLEAINSDREKIRIFIAFDRLCFECGSHDTFLGSRRRYGHHSSNRCTSRAIYEVIGRTGLHVASKKFFVQKR